MFVMSFDDTAIASICDFLKWTENMSVVENDGISFEQTKVYFRGQGDSSWELIPGVFRKINNSFKNSELKGKANEIRLNETRILKEASLRLWSEMQAFQNYTEKLIYLQHYGLKTRLLDVSFNPLIALYMACSDESCRDKEGAVFCGCKTECSDMLAIESCAEYLFTTKQATMDLLDFKDYVESKFQNANIFEAFENPQFIYPPINNPRIEAQNGAFIMAPLIKSYGKYEFRENADSLSSSQFFHEKRAVIAPEHKDGILKELNKLGINEAAIYKDASKKTKTIIQEEIWRLTEKNIDS